MAKKHAAQDNGTGESIAGYFRTVFKQHPKLLGERSNDKLLELWLKDHPDQKDVPNNVKTSLSNIKSVLRSKSRRKPGRPKKETLGQETHGVVAGSSNHGMTATKAPVKSSKLEALEAHIDDCVHEARLLDREGLEDVINLLRRARNAVVWKIGQ